MSTDYLDRVYWPDRSSSANRTTYGFHYGAPALLNEPADEGRRGGPLAAAVVAYSRDGRLDALRLLEKRPQTAAPELPRSRLEHLNAYSSWSATGRSAGGGGGGDRLARPRSYSSRKTLPPSAFAAAAPRDVALRAAPVNDPFVPNSSYKEFVRKKRLAAAGVAWEDAQTSTNSHQIWQRLQKAVKPTVESIGVSETSTRMGRGGGSWRHIKEVLQGMGTRIVFIDGGPSLDDLHRMRSRRLRQHPDRPVDGLDERGQSESVHVDALEKQASESANWRVMR